MKWLLLVCLINASACRDARTNLVSDMDAGSSVMRPSVPDTVSDASPASRADAQSVDAALAHQPSALCGKRPCACDDGLDNDQDGLIDGLDPECTGSYDDDEASFATGQPKKQGECRDCFWDDNAGGKDDGCRYPAECLSGTTPKNNGSCSSCDVSQACQDFCQARTPNGCDCFGCCEAITSQQDHVFVELTDGCAIDRLDDPSACPRCIQNTACANPCGRCELCIGKRASDLPADCMATTANGPTYACDQGQAVCTLSTDCAGASYCQLGCCLVDLL
jgi:hypothetical protein